MAMNHLFQRCLIVSLLCVLTHSIQAQWVKTASSPKGSGITDLAVKQSNGYVFATTGSYDWPNADTGGVHRSTDGGNTWTRVFPAYVARVVLVHPDGRIFASVWDFPVQDESIYYSTDDGDTWVLTWDGAPNNNIFCIDFEPGNPNRMYAGGRDMLILSNNGGLPGGWSVITPVTFGVWAIQVAVQEPYFGIAGRVFLMIQNPTTLATSVYYSNGPPGMGWNLISGTSSTDTLVSMMIARDSTYFGYESQALYVGSSDGKIYKSHLIDVPPLTLVYQAPGFPRINAFVDVDITDAIGKSPAFPPGKKRKRAAGERRGGFDGPSGRGDSGGVFESTDYGQSWESVSDGLPTTNVRMSALAADVTSDVTATVYAGMFLDQNDGGPVYVQNVIGTDVDQDFPGIPSGFSLEQNYPNPFNPTTEIGYRIPETGHVSLTVYDLLGREISTLVNEKKSPGSYTVKWDASGHPSGVYFYRLTTGSFSETRRLVLIR